MKSTLLILSLALSLNMGLSPKDKGLYQVVTSHPHDLLEIAPFVKTIVQDGRLWVVELKPGGPSKVLKHLRPITGQEMTYMYAAPSTLKTFSSFDLEIGEVLKQIDASNIRKEVVALASYKTRAAKTEGNRQATKMVYDKLADIGHMMDTICYTDGACSVIAERKGKTTPDRVIVVMAHLDSVGKDYAGADDNASGTAVVLEIARVLKDYENHSTIRYFITNGEELGLLGATHYVDHLKKSGEVKKIVLTINMDMVGYNSNGIVELETSKEHEALAQWFGELTGKFTTLRPKITLGAWGSDHVPFLNADVPTMLTIEDWSTKTPCYHQACDRPDTLNYAYAVEIAKLNVSAVMTKDQP